MHCLWGVLNILYSLVLRFTCPAIANVGHRPQGWVAFSHVITHARSTAHVGMRIAHRLMCSRCMVRLRSIPIMFLLPIVYVIKIYLVAYLIDRSEAT